MATFYPGVSGDDYRWQYPSVFNNSSNDLLIGHVSTQEYSFGIRFPNVTIPQGSTIVSAKIRLRCYDAYSGALAAYWKINEVDNATAPTNYSGCSGLVLSEGLVEWTIPNGVADTWYESPELKDLLQLVVDRTGFASGNAVQFICACDPSTAERSFYAWDVGSGTSKAELVVEYLNGDAYDFAIAPISLTLTPEFQVFAGGVLVQDLPGMICLAQGAIRSGALSQILPGMSLEAMGETGALGNLNQSLSVAILIAHGGGSGNMELPALLLSAAGITGTVGCLFQNLPFAQIFAHGLSEQRGILSQNLPALSMLAHGFGEALGSLEAVLPALQLSALGLSGSLGRADLTLPRITILASGFAEGIGSLISDLPWLSIYAHGDVIPAIVAYRVLAVNPKNFAVSEYLGFDFNSFALFNGKYLAAGSGGIHVLEGDTDNGVAIEAELKLGQVPVGNEKPRDIYLMGRAEGPMVVTMISDEGEQKRRQIQYLLSSLGEDRAKVPRGLKPTYFQVGVKNAGGNAFDLDSIQVLAEAATVKRRG